MQAALTRLDRKENHHGKEEISKPTGFVPPKAKIRESPCRRSGRAFHRRRPGAHRLVGCLEQGWISLKIRESLRQVDRPAIRRQLGHHGKNGRPDIGKLRVDFQILILVHSVSLTLLRRFRTEPRDFIIQPKKQLSTTQ